MRRTKKVWKSLGLGFLLILSMASLSYAVPKSNITVQPIGLLFGVGNLEYENAWDGASIAGRINFASYNIGDWSTSMFGGGLSYRFYPSNPKEAPRGLFVGPAVDVLSVSSTFEDETGSTIFFSGGVEFGYKWVWGEDVAFVLAPSLSAKYTVGELKIGDDTLSFGGFGVGLGLALGIGF